MHSHANIESFDSGVLLTHDTTMAENELPERPKDVEEDGEKGPSKSALKKAAKEKEKVRTSTY